MCLLCVIQYVGEATVSGAAYVCGRRQGEYSVAEHQIKPKARDWRSYLCCCSQAGRLAEKGNMVLMHGILYMDVEEGRDLPDVDTAFFRSSKDVSDPYVTVDTCTGGKKSCRIAKTSIIYNSLNPHWGEHFRIELCHEVDSFLFSIKDMDLIKVESMGYMSIRAEDLMNEQPITGWFPVFNKSGDPAGSLNIRMHYKSCASITRSNEVPETVYPLRLGCDVTLYQDAHTPAISPVTDISLPDGSTYEPSNLWEDIHKHLEEAKELIYIIGWSVKADICLVRKSDSDCETVGNLLKRKAEEGVRVLVMLWNEVLSTEIYTPGIMGTHDEETRMFFEGTEVEVLLAPRSKSQGKLLEASYVSTLYTHHQKSVIVDAPTDGEKRRLIGFVGGLDITDGRWDIPEHPLYRTLNSEHAQDFYNGCCTSSVTVGPRQPWHDVHSKVEGSIVIDLIANFNERWRKQTPEREHRLVALDEEVFDLEWTASSKPTWGVQLFRSINSDSAQFDTAVLDRLLTRKGRLYENSIQRAYVHHIRRSKRFIYIENQYFLGSSHSWFLQEAKCPHLVPVEIAMRIVNAIKDGAAYRAYVVIPLHPEGDPTSVAVQEILHWQHRTMESMYKKIAKAIHKAGLNTHPTDYLSFFCLGKMEATEDVPADLDEPDEGSVAKKARDHMRFMIYVHSKMAIFDDEYTITGSANINERSMSGNRDSEIAVGMYEEGITKEDTNDGDLQGKIHAYRLALWAEHCGSHSESHIDPTQIGCMNEMRKLGKDNLECFIAGNPEHRDSHLLLYPVDVAQDGHVTAREDCKKFPDTSASVLGKNSAFLPNSLTT